MNVLWTGTDRYKAYHDPDTGLVELFSSRPAQDGTAHTSGDGFVLSTDEESVVVHLSVDVEAVPESLAVPLERPDGSLVAENAEADFDPQVRPTWSFDSAAGVLQIRFDDHPVHQWGRIGTSLLWLALDDDNHLAGIVIEGVSRDPGGAGQLRWLQEAGGD